MLTSVFMAHFELIFYVQCPLQASLWRKKAMLTPQTAWCLQILGTELVFIKDKHEINPIATPQKVF